MELDQLDQLVLVKEKLEKYGDLALALACRTRRGHVFGESTPRSTNATPESETGKGRGEGLKATKSDLRATRTDFGKAEDAEDAEAQREGRRRVWGELESHPKPR